jgi:hypothetical protein
MSAICRFCEKVFTSRYYLTKHQATTKACIKKQNEIKQQEESKKKNESNDSKKEESPRLDPAYLNGTISPSMINRSIPNIDYTNTLMELKNLKLDLITVQKNVNLDIEKIINKVDARLLKINN